jgi:cytochrome c-type biogenesis protein CcmH/NrfG
MLSFTRFAGSRNFADLVSPNYNDQKDYTYGFTVFVSIMASLLFVWAAILIILKYEGERVGCASGRPFQVTIEQATAQSSSSTIIDLDSSIDSTSDVELLDEQRSTNESSKGTREVKMKAIVRRQRRTRIAFFLSGLVVLVCAALLLVFSFSSIRQSTKKADELFAVSQDIINQVKTSVKTVLSASDYANETFASTSWDFNQICPNFASTESLGVDLKELTAVLGTEFNKLQTTVNSNMTNINQTISLVQDTLDKIQGAIEKTDENLWILPAVVLFIFVVAAAVLVTAVLTWTGKSRINFEKRIAYGVLPVLIIVAVICWNLAVGAAISTLVSAGRVVNLLLGNVDLFCFAN